MRAVAYTRIMCGSHIKAVSKHNWRMVSFEFVLQLSVLLSMFWLMHITESKSISCYVCEQASFASHLYCIQVRPSLIKECPKGVTKCYISVNSTIDFKRGCASKKNTFFQQCLNRTMDNCLTCDHDQCNSHPIVGLTFGLKCVQCEGLVQCQIQTSKDCLHQNLLTRPLKCYTQYNENGRLFRAGCLTEDVIIADFVKDGKLIFQTQYAHFEMSTTGDFTCLFEDNPIICKHYGTTDIQGCYRSAGGETGCNREIPYTTVMQIMESKNKKDFLCFYENCNLRKTWHECFQNQICAGIDARCYIQYEKNDFKSVVSAGCEEKLDTGANSALTFYCRNQAGQKNCNDYTQLKTVFGCHFCGATNCVHITNNTEIRYMCEGNATTCYTCIDNSYEVFRGCGTGLEQPFKCRICSEVYCNNEAILEQTLMCPQRQILNTIFKNLRDFFTPTLKKCNNNLYISGKANKCVINIKEGVYEFTCLYDKGCLKDYTCIIPETRLIEPEPLKCFQCRSDRLDERNCKDNLKGLVAKPCGRVLMVHYQSCFVRFVSIVNAVQRGCSHDLSIHEISWCTKPDTTDCLVCDSRACNNKTLKLEIAKPDKAHDRNHYLHLT